MKDLVISAFGTQLVARGGPATSNPAIKARNDLEAAAAFVRARSGGSPKTFDAYRREVFRLLVWLDEHNLTLSEMTVEDVEEFFEHLKNPPLHWRRPRKARSDETLMVTQLLIGPLSQTSVKYSRTVLAHLMRYLQDAGYQLRNVFKLASVPSVTQTSIHSKLLDSEGWQWFWEWLTTEHELKRIGTARAARRRWLFALLYNTGIRREEAAACSMSDFTRADRAWSLRVIGKGNKERFVTVNSPLLSELRRYRRSLNLPEFPVPKESYPLVMSLHAGRQHQHLTPRAIGRLVAETAAIAAEACPDEHTRARLNILSTHWMRHTNASHRLQAKASLESTQDELGHADPRTTRIYAKVHDEARREDAEKLGRLAAQPRKQKQEE